MTDPLSDQENYFSRRRALPAQPASSPIPGYLRQHLPNKNIRILDIGCGLGNQLRGFAQEGFTQLQGVDISTDAVDYCLKTGLCVEQIGRIQDYEAGPFDLIILCHVLEHIPKAEIISALAHIRTNLLAPGGRLFICVPNAQSNTGCYWAYEDFTHQTLFTAGSLLYVMETAGFNELELLDPDGLHGLRGWKRLKRRFWLSLYKRNLRFWNKVTSSYFHAPSPQIFTYELKCIGRP
jgi:SAM-dependent methyltransferase